MPKSAKRQLQSAKLIEAPLRTGRNTHGPPEEAARDIEKRKRRGERRANTAGADCAA